MDIKTTVRVAPHGLRLEQGGWLPPGVDVAVEGWGDGVTGPVVLVCHALTGDAHVASHDSADRPGWWEFMVGPGRPLDPSRVRIVATNALGGCAGTTGPAAAPRPGLPADLYGAHGQSFPAVTVRDMVHVQALVLDALGIAHVDAVVGGSLGGMQALAWAAEYPERVGMVAGLGVSGALSAMALGMNHVQRTVLGWSLQHGDADTALGWARMLAMLTYRSPQHLGDRFGRDKVPGSSRFQVGSYLNHHADKLIERFHPVSYLRLAEAMEQFDLWPAASGSGILAKVRLLGISNDGLFPAADVRDTVIRLQGEGVDASYRELSSEVGHDAFLIAAPDLVEWMDGVVREAEADYYARVPSDAVRPGATAAAGAWPWR